MRRHIATITDVAEHHLCTGCGMCAFVQPDDIEMVDDLHAGRRPVVRDGATTDAALATCPGIHLAHPDPHAEGVIESLLPGWGPVLEVWEGHAGDPEIRLHGSSGGAATALSLHEVEARGRHGVLHIRSRDDAPYLNETTLSRTRGELLAAAGSRYAPASPCDGLQEIVDAPAPCVFVGKPCDVAATAKARATDERLDANLGLTIAIFCAGTPSTFGTLELLDRLGASDPDTVGRLDYRGPGWPGRAEAEVPDATGGASLRSMSYLDSWGLLQKHRQWRCYVCVDHTGEFADVSVGDPWYRDIEFGEHGESLVVVRTERGREAVRAAMASGALRLRRVDPQRLPDSQPGLLETRGSVWARNLTTTLTGVGTPRYENLPTFRHWLRIGPVDQVRSFTGTAKRIVTKRLYRRRPVIPWTPPAPPDRRPYVLVTPVRNGVDTIGATVEAVLSQSVPPARWVIVSDGSTDGTDDLVKELVHEHDHVVLIRRERTGTERSFAAKARAFEIGLAELEGVDYGWIGNLDADVSFEPVYFERLLGRLAEEPGLGIVGGRIVESVDSVLRPQRLSPGSVAGAVQLFRRACFEDVGGYRAIEGGGIDAAAEMTARARGWDVETLGELDVIHDGPVLTGAASPWRTMFNKGAQHHRLGYHPLFQLGSAAFRLVDRPRVIGSIAMLAGFVHAVVTRQERVLPDDVVRHVRREQLHRLRLAPAPRPTGRR